MRKQALLVVAAAMILFAPNGADAGLILRLDDGTNSIEINDNDPLLDSNDILGVVVYNGRLGNGPWFVNVSTAISKPVLGQQPTMDLNSINVSNGKGTITISMTDTDFSFGAGPVGFTSAIGGTTDGTVKYWTSFDSGNTEFSDANPLAAAGSFGPGAFSGTFHDAGVLAGLFSMTQKVEITHSESVHVTSFDAKLSIPEPGTLVLLGLGLLSLGFTSRRARHR